MVLNLANECLRKISVCEKRWRKKDFFNRASLLVTSPLSILQVKLHLIMHSLHFSHPNFPLCIWHLHFSQNVKNACSIFTNYLFYWSVSSTKCLKCFAAFTNVSFDLKNETKVPSCNRYCRNKKSSRSTALPHICSSLTFKMCI